jgi:prepilin-type N-terminal cleavage/methylation domain-containing protein
MMWYKSTQSGFSLMEVLISVSVVGFGLTGLAKMQSSLIQETGESKKKLIAVHLLKEKISDLKQFETLTTEAGLVAYEDIASNTGGSLATGDHNGFNLTWCVDSSDCNSAPHQGNFYYSASNAAPSNVNQDSASVPDFKKIKLSVSWTNPDGQNKVLTAETIIIPKLSAGSGIVATTAAELSNDSSEQTQDDETEEVTEEVTDSDSDEEQDTSEDTPSDSSSDEESDSEEDSSSGEVQYKISGSVSIDSGHPGPKTTSLEGVSLSGEGVMCSFQSTGYFECSYTSNYTGTIYVSGHDARDSVCPSGHTYVNQVGDLENQDFIIQKSGC